MTFCPYFHRVAWAVSNTSTQILKLEEILEQDTRAVTHETTERWPYKAVHIFNPNKLRTCWLLCCLFVSRGSQKSQFSLTESQTQCFSEGGVMAGSQRPAISRSQCTGSGSTCAAVFIQDSCIYTGSGVHQWTERLGSTNTDVMLLPRKTLLSEDHPGCAPWNSPNWLLDAGDTQKHMHHKHMTRGM